MKCEDLLRALNEYVDGTLDPAICATFEAHLEGCNPCQIVIDNIRKTITLYRGEEVFELPAAAKERLQAAMRARWRELHGPKDGL
jgi:anti-sigma factor RsiW